MANQLRPSGFDQCSLHARSRDDEPAELMSHALRLRTLDVRDQKLSLDPESFDCGDLEVCA